MIEKAEERESRSPSRRSDDVLIALIVEDDLSHQVLLRSAFEASGMSVVIAANGFQALRILDVQQPDLVVLDLGLPDFDGVELCRRIRQTQRCPIIVVTADGAEQRMVMALDVGADDYVIKPYGRAALMARVRVAMRHAAAVAVVGEQSTFDLGDLHLDVEAHLVVAGGRTVDLSPRQFRLLTALIRNAGRVVTHKQLALVSSGDDEAAVTVDGLRGAMSHLRKRLGTGPLRPRIATELHIGYRLLEADQYD